MLLHLSGSARLGIEPLCPAHANPLSFRSNRAGSAGLMGM